jgi:hypothetical protein
MVRRAPQSCGQKTTTRPYKRLGFATGRPPLSLGIDSSPERKLSPCMTSPTLTSSAESEASRSPREQPDSARSVSAKSIPTPAASCAPDSEVCATSATCESQELLLGLDLSQCSQAAIPARENLLPGSEKARAMTAGSGRQLATLSKLRGPLGSLVRTCLGTSAWGSTLCSLTWKASVTPRNRLLFQLVPSMPGTEETACGLLPTMTVVTAQHPGRVKLKPGQQTSLSQELNRRFGPTPAAQDAKNAKNATLPPSQIDRDTVPGWMLRNGELGTLNPEWVEWFMGYPQGHTKAPSSSKGSRASATLSSRKSPKNSSAGLPASNAAS